MLSSDLNVPYRVDNVLNTRKSFSRMSVSMVDDLEDFPGRLLHQVRLRSIAATARAVNAIALLSLICLPQAALWDNAELLEDLLHADQLRHIDGVDAWGRTPLHAAATSEGSSCLRILLQSGGNGKNKFHRNFSIKIKYLLIQLILMCPVVLEVNSGLVLFYNFLM